MRIQTSRTETVTTQEGTELRHEERVVTVTASSCYDLERIDDFDDLYQCGLAQAQRMGQMEAFTERFDAEASCDAQEKAMIQALKNYLRPQQAPADLLGRVMHCLDRICDEEQTDVSAAVAGFASAGDSQVAANTASVDGTASVPGGHCGAEKSSQESAPNAGERPVGFVYFKQS